MTLIDMQTEKSCAFIASETTEGNWLVPMQFNDIRLNVKVDMKALKTLM